MTLRRLFGPATLAILAALAAMPVTVSAQPATAPAPHTQPTDAFVYQPAAEVQALTHRTDGPSPRSSSITKTISSSM